jgi:hypothetical protein
MIKVKVKDNKKLTVLISDRGRVRQQQDVWSNFVNFEDMLA